MGRVSTTIQSFDKATQTGIAKSGRSYRLTGPHTEVDADGLAVWRGWLGNIDPAIATDVSSEYA